MLATQAARGKHLAQSAARMAGLDSFVWPCELHGPKAISTTSHGWCIECRQKLIADRAAAAQREATRRAKQRSDPKAVADMRAMAVNYAAIARLRKEKRPAPPREVLQAVEEFVKLWPPQATFDHIVPLKGKTISGLHVWYNLQPTTAESNGIKSARFDPARFPEQRPCNGFPDGQYHGEQGIGELERFLRMDIPFYGLGWRLTDAAPPKSRRRPKVKTKAARGNGTKPRPSSRAAARRRQ